jgi:hypothetical protein
MPSIGDALNDLRAAFPRDQIREETVRVYARELADLDPGDVEAAVRALIRTSQFFPRVSEIREAAAALRLALPSEADALRQVEARTEWARLPEQHRGDPPAIHPVVKDALDLVGGAHAFRSSDQPSVLRGQFLRLFRGLRQDAIREAALGDISAALPPGRAVRAIEAGAP